MRKLALEELGRMSVDEFKAAEKIPVIIVLDNIRSMHNVGSAFRTADAFRVEKMFLCGITGQPPHREIHKSALGATETVTWEYRKEILELLPELRGKGHRIVPVEQTDRSTSLKDFLPGPADRICLVFGNEVFGVNEQVVKEAEVCLEIPQYGTKHSLNISVSIGIVLWDFFNKMSLGMALQAAVIFLF